MITPPPPPYDDNSIHSIVMLNKLLQKMESFVEPCMARVLQTNISQNEKIADNLRLNHMLMNEIRLNKREERVQEQWMASMEHKVDYLYSHCFQSVKNDMRNLKQELLYKINRLQMDLQEISKELDTMSQQKLPIVHDDDLNDMEDIHLNKKQEAPPSTEAEEIEEISTQALLERTGGDVENVSFMASHLLGLLNRGFSPDSTSIEIRAG